VPIKDFRRAKLRLAPCLDAQERSRLARAMAAQVIAAAAPLPTVVVCDDEAVAGFARDLHCHVEWTPGLGLNGAVAEAVRRAAARAVDRVVVSHADLPLAVDLAVVADFDGVTLVPDRHGQGTNVASVPALAGFGWAYGVGSFERHQAEARRLGLPLRVMEPPSLTWDVDRPDDLAVPAGAQLSDELAGLLRRSGC